MDAYRAIGNTKPTRFVPTAAFAGVVPTFAQVVPSRLHSLPLTRVASLPSGSFASESLPA
jgi:hypothetical protein